MRAYTETLEYSEPMLTIIHPSSEFLSLNNSGTIPTEFAKLSYLETLSFRHTNITGNVEEVICRDGFEWDGVYADCVEELECSCCVNCCTNEECCDRDGQNCYSNEWIPIHEQ